MRSKRVRFFLQISSVKVSHDKKIFHIRVIVDKKNYLIQIQLVVIAVLGEIRLIRQEGQEIIFKLEFFTIIVQ